MSFSSFPITWARRVVGERHQCVITICLSYTNHTGIALLLLTDAYSLSLASSALTTFRLSAAPTPTFPRDKMT